MTSRVTLGRLAVGLGLAAVLAGGLVWATRPGEHPAKAQPVVDRGAVPTSSSTSSSRPASSSPPAPSRTDVPSGSTLHIPALHVSAPVGRVRVVDGVMQIPQDPSRVAWWRGGAVPGNRAGSAVIVGHINFHGVSGALASLPDLEPGDALRLTEPGASPLRYRVAAVRTYPKSSGIPADAFSRTGVARLVLITCGGPFDSATGNYEDNVVVYAVPA